MANTQSRLKFLKKAAHEALRANDYERAWLSISDALNMNMDDPETLYMAGVFMRHKGHGGMAGQLFRRCCALEPNELNPWLHFGAALHDTHNYDAAIEVFRYCIQLEPRDAACYANIAACYQMKGQFADALNYTDKALGMRPKLEQAICVKAMACLGLERWKEGFELYKHLYGHQLKIRVYCQPEEPEWDGTKGQTVVVQADQGIGDEIRFASVLPDMARDCKQLILECNPRLEHVFRRAFPQLTVYGTKKERSALTWPLEYEIDAHYHISGLGRFYRHKDADFPRTAFLVPDDARVAKWRALLADKPKPWVGIAWVGGSITTGREHRSTALADWAPLIRQGGTFVDLSYHDSKAEAEASGVLHVDIDQQDYDDSLALVSVLDLTVCVPTAVLHAAGSLGKPCWVLVPQFPNWEFGRERSDMIWYSPDSVRLFRTSIEDMADEFARVYRSRSPSTPGVHGVTELDSTQSERAGADLPALAPTVAHQPTRPHGVHF